MPTNTNARGAAVETTALTRAVWLRSSRPLTPYHPQAWLRLLRSASLLSKYPNLHHSLFHGFHLGIPPILYTNAPPNSPSIVLLSSEFSSIVDSEFLKHRYLGPFTRATLESLIGPFQTSPLSLVPKPHKPSAFRLVQNFSFPYFSTPTHASINSYISSDNYPCTWGTFAIFSFLTWHLPPGTQAAVRDVAEAFRTIPLHPSQWPGTVVRLSGDDSFAIDTNAAFGTGSTPGIYGNLEDAGVDVLRSAGLGPISKWADDHVFFRMPREHLAAYNSQRTAWRRHVVANGGCQRSGGRIWYNGPLLPDGSHAEFEDDMCFPIRDLSTRSPRSPEDACFTSNLTDVDFVTSQLGIPWQAEKDIPFSHVFPFTGFLWNLKSRTVTIIDTKREKYHRALTEWKSSRVHALLEVQKLYGKLLHASSVIPEGRAYLTGLEAMLSLFHDEPFKPRTPPRHTPEEISWWLDKLSRHVQPRPIPGPHTIADLNAFSDASSGVGIGIIIGSHWRAWTLLPGWRADGRDIGWAEAVGFELLVRTHLVLHPSTPDNHHFLVYGDNKGVVEGWWNGRSRNRHVNTVFRRLHSLLNERGAVTHTRYIPSARNPADAPSRGIYPSWEQLLPLVPLPDALCPLIAPVESPHPLLGSFTH